MSIELVDEWRYTDRYLENHLVAKQILGRK
jgi:hypothetical protein